MSERAEQILHRTLFRSALAAAGAGTLMTVMMQSSSITTSMMIPLVGAGVVTLEQLLPFTLGANIGTTITTMLAALATGNPAAVTVAFSHLLFNVTASLIIYLPPPLRAVPLALARGLGRLARQRRWLAAAYILVFFYGLPIVLLFASGSLSSHASAPEDDQPPEIRSGAGWELPIDRLYLSAIHGEKDV